MVGVTDILKIVCFTGAGISSESGLSTFRGDDGLWEGQRPQDVCSTQAWANNPEKVLEFYNHRRAEVRAAVPNAAHLAIAALERDHEVLVATQNVDNLHERAGSTNILHLHGLITKQRSERDASLLVDCAGDITLGDLAADGAQQRPHIVFFGETPYFLDEALAASKKADLLIVVGTSLKVYPAAYIAEKTGAKEIWIADPNPPHFTRTTKMVIKGVEVLYFRDQATKAMTDAVKLLPALEKTLAAKHSN